MTFSFPFRLRDSRNVSQFFIHNCAFQRFFQRDIAFHEIFLCFLDTVENISVFLETFLKMFLLFLAIFAFLLNVFAFLESFLCFMVVILHFWFLETISCSSECFRDSQIRFLENFLCFVDENSHFCKIFLVFETLLCFL